MKWAQKNKNTILWALTIIVIILIIIFSKPGNKNEDVVVDENGFQAMGTTREVLALGSIADKLTAFGFETVSVDGHDEKAIEQAVRELWASTSEQPKAIVAKTVKGKGVSFMEHNNLWHYTRLNEDTYAQACAEVLGASR